MKTGINLIPEAPVGEMVGLAVAAEDLGFDRCWVYDEGLATRDVHLTLGAIAAATSRLELGPGITNPFTRHPAQTAATIATLDELSEGRAFLGIGAGGTLTLAPMGLAPARPMTAVRETIEVCRALFATAALGASPVDHDGETVRLRSARLDHGRSGIEIWLAGRGPRMLRLGGATADGVMLDFIHRPSLGRYVDLVAEGAADGGRSAAICYSTALVIDDHDLEVVRPHLTYRLVDAPAPVKEAMGMAQADVDRIRSALAGGLEEAAAHVRDEWVLPFVIAGSAPECATSIGDLVDRHGFVEFLLPMFPRPDPVEHLRQAATVLAQAR